MIQIEAFDHVHILAPAGSEPAVRAFYHDLLGLAEVEKPPELRPRGGAWFRIGAGPVLLHVGTEADPPPAGRRHFACRVADVAAARAYLAACGVLLGEAPAVAGMPRFYAFDPWGNQIEFLQYTAAPVSNAGTGEVGAVLTPQPPSHTGKGETSSLDPDAAAVLTPQPPSHTGKGASRGRLSQGDGQAEADAYPHALLIGQPAPAAQVQRAKELRRQMTPTEAILWEHLRANRLDGLHFRRQHVIAGFIVDFYCHAANLVVEVDGAVHNTRREYDAARDEVLTAQGLRLLRVKNQDVNNDLPGTLRRIAQAASSRFVSNAVGGAPTRPDY